MGRLLLALIALVMLVSCDKKEGPNLMLGTYDTECYSFVLTSDPNDTSDHYSTFTRVWEITESGDDTSILLNGDRFILKSDGNPRVYDNWDNPRHIKGFQFFAPDSLSIHAPYGGIGFRVEVYCTGKKRL